jgi:hypothetical protein
MRFISDVVMRQMNLDDICPIVESLHGTCAHPRSRINQARAAADGWQSLPIRRRFYAGARALLVSHWAVESKAATTLTTSTFDLIKSDPKLGRAEALRRAMLAYMNDATDPLSAYPALWAPFVVVGEGAARSPLPGLVRAPGRK